jgi:SAM-dependent methyltransferase
MAVQNTKPASTTKLAAARRGMTADLLEFDAFDSLDASRVRGAPARFTEKGFTAYIAQLCAAGKHEAAAKYFLQHAHELLESNLNPKEKLNHFLFLPRLIQAGSGTKHGYQKLLRKAQGVENFLTGLELPPGGAFVELGCGAHDPLALSTYYFLNGFEPCYGVDLLEPRNELYSALSMYDILSNVRSFPRRYCRTGTDPHELLGRLQELNLAAFERGKFDEGFGKARDKVVFKPVDVVKAGIGKGSVSLLVSFAVLEHVSDIKGVCESLFDLLKPGGVAFHFVDLADHRAYRGDPNFGPLSFLIEPDAPKNMNRLRAPEITEMHQRTGFEILKDVRGMVDMPKEIEAKLLPRFRSMALDDVRAIKQQLLVRRPA